MAWTKLFPQRLPVWRAFSGLVEFKSHFTCPGCGSISRNSRANKAGSLMAFRQIFFLYGEIVLLRLALCDFRKTSSL